MASQRGAEAVGEASAETPAERPASQAPPAIPDGIRLHVPGRGGLFVREAKGPPGAPTLLLLHGWLATGALNWQHVFEPLGEHFRVVAPDLRGHGRGLKTWRRFRLEDCADDVAAVLERLDTGPVIAAGYSMGGPVAQLLWRRHRSQVAGLVLCATSDRMTPTSTQRFAQSTVMGAVMGTTRLGQLPARLPKWVARRILPKGVAGRPLQLPDWGMREVQRHDVRMLMEAGYAIGRHDAKPWIEGVDVPTSVVVTLEDRAIPARLQRDMAKRIRGSRVVDVQDGHVLCNRPAFAAPLLHACLEVKRRAYARGGDARTRRRKRGA